MKLDYKNHYYLFPDNLYGKININMLFLFFFSFGIIYRIIQKTKYPREKIYYLTNKIISCIHALVSSYGAIIYLSKDITYEVWNDKYIMISKMYLIFDVIMMFVNRDSKQQLLHHLIFYFGLGYNDPRRDILALAVFAELTNFNLYIGWFMISIGYDKSTYFKVNAIILLILFFFLRVINYIYLSYVSLITLTYKYGLNFGGFFFIGLAILQIHWFILLLKKAMNMNKTKTNQNKLN